MEKKILTKIKKGDGTSPNRNRRRDGISPIRNDSGRYRNWSEQSDRNKISPEREKRTNREGRTPPKGNFSQSRSPSKEKTMTRDSRKND